MSDRISYSSAGVDIETGDRFAAGISAMARRTMRPEVLSGIGGFAGLFQPNTGGMSEPVLVSGTDGVGTKLMIAQRAGKHDTIGIDLVAMCVNDVLTIGADPLFFLDYLATGKLEPDVGNAVLEGIIAGCEQAGCALLGGETAEMPGMYPEGKYDLAGFCVGMVDKPKIIDGRTIVDGDAILGLPSNGLHSNGYSLMRHVLFERENMSLDTVPDGWETPLVDALLAPTKIYSKATLAATRNHTVHGMAHITGGGLSGNVARVVPDGLVARFDEGAWTEPPIFQLMRDLGVPDEEMEKTFNRGLGMVIICPEAEVDALTATLADIGEPCIRVGRIQAAAESAE